MFREHTGPLTVTTEAAFPQITGNEGEIRRLADESLTATIRAAMAAVALRRSGPNAGESARTGVKADCPGKS